jgi:hypothetical protein
MLKAGTETGSLINHLYSRQAPALPKVGDGATLLGWTDRHAATVVEVKETPTQVKVTVQVDHATRIDGNVMSESQVYVYAPNPDAQKVTYTFAKLPDGRLKQLGAKRQGGLALGYRDEYYDFSF